MRMEATGMGRKMNADQLGSVISAQSSIYVANVWLGFSRYADSQSISQPW